MATELSASLEDYIEGIYNIIEEEQAVRVTDIAARLNVKKASVSGAMHSLADKGLVNYAPYDVITLTGKGRRAARDVVFRHRTLRDFFVKVLAIEDDEADEAACRLEHAMPPHVMDRLAAFAAFVEECPRAGPDWIENFKKLDKIVIDRDECSDCVGACMEALKRGKSEI